MLKNYLISNVVLKFIIPYVILYAIYIQLNGKISPGGGFQAGVIFATGLIAYSLLNGLGSIEKIFSSDQLLFVGILGVALYGATGLISLFFNDNYLNYYSINSDPILAQHIGIFSIEIGVGLTVSAVMTLIYVKLQ